MPLVRIDVTDDRTAAQAQAVATAVHRAIVDEFAIPERDKFQIITRHPAGEIIAEDAGLGFGRQSPIVVHIFTQTGRTVEAKQALYARIAEYAAPAGLEGRDLFIGYFENEASGWSFGFGEAQYVTGALTKPGSAPAV
jgi:phenylpyruvate tautomerase PptA (4-oxalocrotonate tautomerase family)